VTEILADSATIDLGIDGIAERRLFQPIEHAESVIELCVAVESRKKMLVPSPFVVPELCRFWPAGRGPETRRPDDRLNRIRLLLYVGISRPGEVIFVRCPLEVSETHRVDLIRVIEHEIEPEP
jgi:hypothetical protein